MPDLRDTAVVLDFDGTSTLPLNDQGDGSFCTAWSRNFPRKTGLRITAGEVQAFCRATYRDNHAHPERYAWRRDGFDACALSDPLLLVGEVGRRIFDRFDHLRGDDAERQRILDQVYLESYPVTQHFLRPETPTVLNLLREENATLGILTNSDPDKVKTIIARECERLGRPGALDWIFPFVKGFARKGTITPSTPLSMRSSKRIPGLNRNILLRRGHAIAATQEIVGAKKRVIIVDDNPELGLHWAEELGYETVLLANDETPGYELDYYSSGSSRRHCILDLNELVRIVRGG